MICIYIKTYTWQFLVTFWGMVKWLLQWSIDLQIGAKKVTLNHLACTNICTCVYVYIFVCLKTKRTLNHMNNSSCWFLSVHFWRRFSHPKPQGKKGDLMNSSPRSDLILPWNDYSQITCWEWDQLGWIHPARLKWNLRIHPWKRKIIFQTIIFRFDSFIFQGVCFTLWGHESLHTIILYSNGPWHWMFRGEETSRPYPKNKNFQWLYTPETNQQHLPGGRCTERKFIFQPKWGAKYWFQGGYSTVLANQRFANDTTDQKGTTHSYSHLYSVLFISISERTNKNKGC